MYEWRVLLAPFAQVLCVSGTINHHVLKESHKRHILVPNLGTSNYQGRQIKFCVWSHEIGDVIF